MVCSSAEGRQPPRWHPDCARPTCTSARSSNRRHPRSRPTADPCGTEARPVRLGDCWSSLPTVGGISLDARGGTPGSCPAPPDPPNTAISPPRNSAAGSGRPGLPPPPFQIHGELALATDPHRPHRREQLDHPTQGAVVKTVLTVIVGGLHRHGADQAVRPRRIRPGAPHQGGVGNEAIGTQRGRLLESPIGLMLSSVIDITRRRAGDHRRRDRSSPVQ